MAKITSRRSFLGNSLMATTSLAFFTSTDIVHAFTADESPFKGYNPFATVKDDLRRDPFGKHVEVSGRIFDESGTQALHNVSVEIWHLSPDSEQFRHRARLYTDNNGEYRFITDMPAREMGKNYKVFFKISDKSKSYFTELSFNNTGAFISSEHWKKNNQLGDDLLFPKHKTFINTSNITFNISLNNH